MLFRSHLGTHLDTRCRLQTGSVRERAKWAAWQPRCSSLSCRVSHRLLRGVPCCRLHHPSLPPLLQVQSITKTLDELRTLTTDAPEVSHVPLGRNIHRSPLALISACTQHPPPSPLRNTCNTLLMRLLRGSVTRQPRAARPCPTWREKVLRLQALLVKCKIRGVCPSSK